MKMRAFRSILPVFIAGTSLLSSCVKERDFPDTPVIAFKQYIGHGRDSADCIITFRDGDGDIGIKSSDPASPNDLFLAYLYKDPVDGEFKPFVSGNYSYRVPDLTQEGKFKALEGEIRAKLRAQPIYHPDHTIIKFEITLRDHAGHLSNKITTPEIYLP